MNLSEQKYKKNIRGDENMNEMRRAILIDVSRAGLAILCRWDLESLERLAKAYSATIIKPLMLVDFDTGILFKVWESAEGNQLKIREVAGDVKEAG